MDSFLYLLLYVFVFFPLFYCVLLCCLIIYPFWFEMSLLNCLHATNIKARMRITNQVKLCKIDNNRTVTVSLVIFSVVHSSLCFFANCLLICFTSLANIHIECNNCQCCFWYLFLSPITIANVVFVFDIFHIRPCAIYGLQLSFFKAVIPIIELQAYQMLPKSPPWHITWHIPYAPCIECLPAVGWFFGYM